MKKYPGRKTRKGLLLLLILVLASTAYYLYTNRNSKNMTGRQKILKAFYPIITGVTRLFGVNNTTVSNNGDAEPKKSVYEIPVKLINGNTLDLHELAGKKILFVNTASDCGYTKQYEELQQLQDQYQNRLQIIAFPANDFKQQERGSDEQILSFCKLNYGVRFPLASKSTVLPSAEQNAVYRWLTSKELNGWNDKSPSWNFSKYLVDEKGKLTHYFDPSVSPLGKTITSNL